MIHSHNTRFPTPGLIGSLKDDVRYLSASCKDDREHWVFERWCMLTGRKAAAARKGEGPDFTLEAESIEIVEVLEEDRRRHSEFKKTLNAAQANPPAMAVHVGPNLKTVAGAAHQWILSAIEAKQKRYHSTAAGWTLLIYANFTFADRTDWSAVRRLLASKPPVFKRVEALLPDGKSHLVLFPWTTA